MEVNIEKIMSEIRAEIKEKGYTSDILSFEEVRPVSVSVETEFSSKALSDALFSVNSAYVIPVEPPIVGNPIAVFIKKIIRKLSRFYVRPAREQQNDYNAYVAGTLNIIGKYIAANSTDVTVAELSAKIDTLELQIRSYSSEREELLRRIARLESALEAKKPTETE